MKQKIRITESDLHKIIKESVRNVILEKITAKKLQQLADEHGGFDFSYFRNGGGVGSPYRNYVGEMPDDCVLGVGKVDLHIYPHKKFEIDGVSDDDMEQLRLRDGQYLYYNKRKMAEYIQNRSSDRNIDDKTPDGAFVYQGKYSKDIDKKKVDGYADENSFSQKFYEKFDNAKRTLAIAKNDIQKLLGMNTAFDMDSDVNEVLSSIEKLQATIKKVEDNATDNFYNRNVDGGHYWRSGQNNNVQKFMKPRDSRLANRQGRTDSYYDVQGGGIWGHNNSHREPSHTTAPYR